MTQLCFQRKNLNEELITKKLYHYKRTRTDKQNGQMDTTPNRRKSLQIGIIQEWKVK